MKKKYLYISLLIPLIAIAVLGFYASRKFFEPKKVHYHAGFVVYQHNKKLDFSSPQYMKVEPCSLHEKEDTVEDIQGEKAHLHDNVGDIVHVERAGGTWGDLFKNLKYTINYKNAKAYLSGKEIPNFQNVPINTYDSLVIFLGDNDQKLKNSGVTKQYMQIKEKKSDGCGS